MRSLLLTADTVGGVYSYAIDLARELAACGITVHLATLGDALRPAQRAAAAAIPSLVLHESVYALEWMEAPGDDLERAADWLREVERAVRPDLVHANSYVQASAGLAAPVVVGAHSCVLSWWRAVHGEDAPSRFDAYARRVRDGLAAASAVIAPSAAMLACLAEHYGPLGSRGHVVPNGIPPAKVGAIAKEPVVLTAGRLWDRAKNLEALVRIASRLSWPLAVAGWSSAHEPLPDVPLPLGWLGPEELSTWMARAAVFALPARYEPFGLCALEAAQQGAALVLGDIPSLREVWGDAALFVPPDDDRAIEAALERIVGDAGLRHEMSRRARLRAARYDSRTMTSRTLAVYDRVLQQREVMSCA